MSNEAAKVNDRSLPWSEVPWYRKELFVFLLLFFLAPIGALWILFVRTYHRKKDRGKPIHFAIRLVAAIVFTAVWLVLISKQREQFGAVERMAEPEQASVSTAVSAREDWDCTKTELVARRMELTNAITAEITRNRLDMEALNEIYEELGKIDPAIIRGQPLSVACGYLKNAERKFDKALGQ